VAGALAGCIGLEGRTKAMAEAAQAAAAIHRKKFLKFFVIIVILVTHPW
jgi:hypothetical protein